MKVKLHGAYKLAEFPNGIAFIAKTDGKGPFPVETVYRTQPHLNWETAYHTLDGKWLLNGGDSPYDLIEFPKEQSNDDIR